ncbi:PREDICTED: uncharacterized protein LOC108776765 [Cyphomyrmex costatus]|uniref:uncharacterized protein LOC108776765 n=1 Tax=Cyphomyrmex costatus TaxID=456900 RepID=UPI00085228B4|nr:PREDICTED: uncharacterized protein LOC108776765 [Cyphomyrmex costatus]
MPYNYCVIPNCVQRYKCSKKSVFRVPSNIKQREEWIVLIQHAYHDIRIPKIFLVCEDHFKENDIITRKVIKNSDGKVIFERKLIRKRLKDGANPSFTCSQKREILNIDSEQQQIDQVDEGNLIEDSRSNQDNSDTTLTIDRDSEGSLIEDGTSNQNSSDVPSLPVALNLQLQPTSPMYCEEQQLLIEKQNIFQKLLHNEIQVNLPDITWGFHRTFELRPQMLFTQANMSKEKNMIIIKQVIIYENLQYKVLFFNKEALLGQHILGNLNDINLLLQHAHNLALCQGGPVINNFKNIHSLCAIQDNITNTWRHKKCPIQTSGEEVCKFCVSLYKSLQQNAVRNEHRISKKIVLTPSTHKKVIALRAAK